MIPKPPKRHKRHKMTIECDISPKVRKAVKERDNGASIISGLSGCEVAHYIGRAQCGLGIPENLVLLTKQEHLDYDNGDKREEYGKIIEEYLKRHYEGWDRAKLVYNKFDK